MKTKLLMLLFVGIITTFFQGKTNKKIKLIDNVLNFYTHCYDFNGVILVAESGNIIYKKVFGYANYEWDIPNTVDTKFRIASITKGFTAFLILKLIEEGKVNLNDKIIKYLPEIDLNMGENITIKHLLIHQSGLKEYGGDLSKNHTKIDILKNIPKDDELLYLPGTREQYCNFNYFLLGIIIERISGKSLSLVLKEEILSPLDMNDTGVDNGERMIKNIAMSNYLNQVNQGDEPYHVFLTYWPNKFALGDVYLTIDDLYTWVQASFSNRIIKEETRNLFIDNDNFIYDTPAGGFTNRIMIKGKERRVARGDGSASGFRSLFLYFPDENHTIIMFCNNHYFQTSYDRMPFYDKIPYTIARILYDDKYELPKIPICKVLIKEIENGSSVDKVINKYNRIKDEREKYLIDEKQLNRVAYYYLEKDRLGEAFQIFKLNLQNNSESWFVYDGIGEYYYRSGNKNKAIEYFKMSLEKNPNKYREQRKLYRLRKEITEIIDK